MSENIISAVPKVKVKILAFTTFFLELECATPEDFDIAIEMLQQYKIRQNELAESRLEMLGRKAKEVNEALELRSVAAIEYTGEQE